MKTRHRFAHTLAFGCLAALAAPLPALAIGSAQDAIATSAYQKNMRTLTMMEKIDTNGDHQVSHEELDAYFGKIFDALDRNHDGTLDKKEWVGAAHDKDMVSLSNGGYARALSSMDMMRIVDKDNDHTVSRDEFIKAHEAMYTAMAAGETGPLDAKHWVAGHFPK
jgi:hypothetical protein